MSAGKRVIKHCKIKKDYQRKNLNNPFFRRDHKNKQKRTLNIKYYIIGICIILSFIIYGLFFSPWLVIKNIKIKGLGRLPESAISERLWNQTNQQVFWLLNQKNILLFNKKSAKLDLLANFNFSKIEIKKSFFNSLIVNIEERPYAFVWQEKGQSYYSDSKGFIIKDSLVSPEDVNKFPVIENQTPDSLIENDYLKIDENYLVFIFTVKNESDKNSEIAINKFFFSQESNTVKVLFKNGLLAYFNVKDDVLKQIDKLLVVKREKIKDNIGSVNYVDLRYGDKVYIGNK